MFKFVAIFICIAAVASYINYRYIKLPSTIGLMVIGLTISLILIGINAFGIEIEAPIAEFLGRIDFAETLRHTKQVKSGQGRHNTGGAGGQAERTSHTGNDKHDVYARHDRGRLRCPFDEPAEPRGSDPKLLWSLA